MESMVTIWWGSLKGRNELGGRGGNGVGRSVGEGCVRGGKKI